MMCNVHEVHKKRQYISRSSLIYSTKLSDNSYPNKQTINKYNLKYNYEDQHSYQCAVDRNQIEQLNSGALISQSFLDHIQPKEVPILCSSCESEPLYSSNESITIKNYYKSEELARINRKRRYIEFFKRHYGTL